MRRHFLVIVFLLLVYPASADNTIIIPLKMSVFSYMPQDGPTGSTPDPTDPNQFRASLTGNTLQIETQKDAVSYVVIREAESDQRNEDYFYGISYGEISCPVTRSGMYVIRIGYWKTDFTGYLYVRKISVTDFNGHLLTDETPDVRIASLPPGYYILRVETTSGTTTSKFFKRL